MAAGYWIRCSFQSCEMANQEIRLPTRQDAVPPLSDEIVAKLPNPRVSSFIQIWIDQLIIPR